LYWTLKDFAMEMDCHLNTARKWVLRINIPPDIRGHGALRWKEVSARKLLKIWNASYTQWGTSLKIQRLKYKGEMNDARQLNLPLQDFLPHIPPPKKKSGVNFEADRPQTFHGDSTRPRRHRA
jgi:hypothetical protein